MRALQASGWMILLMVVVTATAFPQSFGISWVKRYEYNLQVDSAHRIGADAQGNVYVVGTTDSSIYGVRQIVLLKYSSDGQLLWQRQYPVRAEGYSPISLYVLLTGRTHLLLREGYPGDYLLLTHDAEGNLLWAQVYDGTSVTWQSDDTPYALGVDGAGNVYVTGSSKGYATGSDITTVKYSASGQPLWVRRYSASMSTEAGTALAVSRDGVVYVAGGTQDSAGRLAWVVLKYDARGNLRWSVREEESAVYSETSQPAFAQLDQEGNLYVAGGLPDNLVAKKYEPGGTRLWRMTYSLDS